jgi:hypothetical protein
MRCNPLTHPTQIQAPHGRTTSKARLRRRKRPVNDVKDYIAILSAVAYLKWRAVYQAQDIAEYLQVPEPVVWYTAFILRENATRLGLKFPRQKTWRGPKKYISPEEFSRRLSEGVKASWSRPDVRERHVKAAREFHARPEFRARMSAAAKKAQNRPDVRARQAAAQRATKAKPEYKARINAKRKAAWARGRGNTSRVSSE